ncbi:hypothetical protein [Algiphilus sp.]|uniref:hypothetical protein n=1 Tax=Algiphilus sp. TaxID=1872431 RepID=UPI003B51B6CA
MPAWRVALRPYLEACARARRPVSYREVLDALAVPGPRQMGRLTAALEATMAEDVAAGQPLRAAVVVSQVAPVMPRAGFFAEARALGRYAGPDTGPEAQAFHARECAALFEELAETPGGPGPDQDGAHAPEPST